MACGLFDKTGIAQSPQFHFVSGPLRKWNYNIVNEATQNPRSVRFLEKRKWDTKPKLLASIEKAEKLVNYRPIVVELLPSNLTPS